MLFIISEGTNTTFRVSFDCCSNSISSSVCGFLIFLFSRILDNCYPFERMPDIVLFLKTEKSIFKCIARFFNYFFILKLLLIYYNRWLRQMLWDIFCKVNHWKITGHWLSHLLSLIIPVIFDSTNSVGW